MTSSHAHRALADLLIVVAAKALSVAAMLLCASLAARALGTGGYGHFAAALSLLLLLDGMIGAPLDLAVVRFGSLHRSDSNRSATIQTAILRAKLAFAVLLLLLAWPLARPLTRLLVSGAEPALVPLLLASLVVLLVLRSYAAQLQVAGHFRAYAVIDLAQAVLRIGGVLVVWGLLHSANAAAYFAIYGASAGAVLVIVARRHPQPVLTAAFPGRDDVRQLVSYVAGTAGIVALGTFTGRSDVPLVSAAFGAEAAGLYGTATQLAALGTMLATYVGIVTQPRLLGWAQSRHLDRVLVLNAALACLLGVLLLVPALVTGVIVLLFGDAYLAALPVVAILLGGACIDFLIMPVLLPYALQFEPRRCLRGEALVTAVYALGMVWALDRDIVSVAWLVTGVRVAKLVLYGGIFFATRDAHKTANQ